MQALCSPASNGPIAKLRDTWDDSKPRVPKAKLTATVRAVVATAREAGGVVVLDAAFQDRDEELADVDALLGLDQRELLAN